MGEKCRRETRLELRVTAVSQGGGDAVSTQAEVGGRLSSG